MLFPGLKSITADDVAAFHEVAPRRRQIREALLVRTRADGTVVFSAPFHDSIVPIFSGETGLHPISGNGSSYHLYLKDEDDADLAEDWQVRRRDLVFLRDRLDLSIALDVNQTRPGEYTNIGRLEHDAKARLVPNAIAALAVRMARAVNELPGYRNANLICPVPPSPGKQFDLPTRLVRLMTPEIEAESMSSDFRFARAKRSIKGTSLADKWAALEAADLQVSRDLTGLSVVLVDDKYQSGTTIHFAASKLYAAGASDVFGLCCVKTLSDTDNT